MGPETELVRERLGVGLKAGIGKLAKGKETAKSASQ